MKLPLRIARRYLFSKKSHNAINIISAISVVGVALATLAMVCTLSVFNGFHDLVGSLFTHFDPQLNITSVAGKTFAYPSPAIDKALKESDVAAVSPCLEDQALILFQGKPTVIHIKGVSDSFSQVTDIDSILYTGTSARKGFQLHAAEVEYGIPGYGLAGLFGTLDYGTIEICAPRPGERINLTNPLESFNVANLTSNGLVFQVNQRKYDDTYILTSLRFAQTLFEKANQVSSLELKLRPEANESEVKAQLEKALGAGFYVKNRFEQQEDTFRLMNVEKMVAYVFLSFIVLVASFNIIGSVSMLIIEKRNDMQTLRFLGAKEGMVTQVFFFSGTLISVIGAGIGIVLGLGLSYAQQTWGFITLAGSESNFIVRAYPVSVHLWDVVAVFFTVILVGMVSVWYPVRHLSRGE